MSVTGVTSVTDLYNPQILLPSFLNMETVLVLRHINSKNP